MRRSASGETRSSVVEEVDEWIPSVAAVDLEWPFRCHGCGVPERFSLKYIEDDDEYTRYLLRAEEGKANCSH